MPNSRELQTANKLIDNNGSPRWFYFALVFFIVAISHLWMPKTNMEFAFESAASYFAGRDPNGLNVFFEYQANPIALPWVAGKLCQTFEFLEPLQALRLLVALGAFPLAFSLSGFVLANEKHRQCDLFILLFLNPLVWAYAFRATADFLPAAIAVSSALICLQHGSRPFIYLLSAVGLAIAVVLKYHALVLFPLWLIIAFRCHKGQIKYLLSIAAIIIVAGPLSLFLVQVHHFYGVWWTPEKFKVVHGIELSGMISNWVAYSAFLSILIFTPFFATKELWAWLMRTPFLVGLVAVCVGLLSIAFLGDSGEMNFGPLDRFFKPEARLLLFGALAGLFPLLGISILREHRNSIKKPALVSDNEQSAQISMLYILSFAVLIAFCVSRPAQRYLLFVLPFMILVVWSRFQMKGISRQLVWMALIGLGIFSNYSRWCTGEAARRVVTAIEDFGLVGQVTGGAIIAHVGDAFEVRVGDEAQYHVVAGTAADARIVAKVGFAGVGRSFSVVPCKGAVECAWPSKPSLND